jgi:pimeloyl-ACP methyl ester carboxylesterase
MAMQVADFVEIEGKQVYYEMAGEGPTVVLIHAGFLDHRMWDDQWDVLRRHYRVLRYDMRGYGKSDSLNAPTARRAELAALLQQVGVDRAYFVGCSMGGTTALDFALEHPDQVLGLVIVNGDPSGFEMQGAMPPEVTEMIDAIQQRDLPRISELQMRLWIDGPYRQPHEVNGTVRQRAAAMNQVPVRNFTFVVADMNPADPLQPPATERLHEIHVPTLCIVGALDNPEINRAADVIVAGIAGARKEVIKGAAHIPNMEQPDVFNRILF